MEQSDASSEHYEHQVFYPSYNEHRYCTSLRSIDTVRALHQTVVSLRSALEDSKQEIEKLKKQILINNEIQNARQFVHHETASQPIDYKTLGDKVSELEKIYYKCQMTSDDKGAAANMIDSEPKNDANTSMPIAPTITVSTKNPRDAATSGNDQMASRIDVKIKVSSNINLNDNDTSSDNSEISETKKITEHPSGTADTGNQDKEENVNIKTKSADSSVTKPENPKVEVEIYGDKSKNTLNVDAKNLKIKVTSADAVNFTRSVEKIYNPQNSNSSEYLNLDIDEMSEGDGDNSVFTEGATTPIEQRLQQVEDIGSENENADSDEDVLPRDEKDEDDIPEDFDDIELIFSSDDNKDIIQEDLVSLSEYEPWQEQGATGTPILTKFSTLTSDDRDREAYYERKKAIKAARIAKTREKAKSLDATVSGMGERIIKNTDSLSFDNSNIINKSSSLEKNASTESPLSRDASLDTFEYSAKTSALDKKWTNFNVLIETDISKVGIGEESVLDMGRRNTCPNPPLYRPLGYSQNRALFRSPLATRYPRSPHNTCPLLISKSAKTQETDVLSKNDSKKCSSSAQTDISALPHLWRSETQLTATGFCLGRYTLPSKYTAPTQIRGRSVKNSLRLSEKTQEARRILLSDINFTSMVPELSRSADHLFQQKIAEETDENADYLKGNLLKTPDYVHGMTPSTSMMASPNDSTTQTQTDGFWGARGDSFDSTKSYSLRSENALGTICRHQRSRSVPSIRCTICKYNHYTMKPSESMHSTTKTVTFQEPSQKIRGSLPDIRHDCTCPRYTGGRSILYHMHESSGSTESLLEEADEFLRHCPDEQTHSDSRKTNRRCSEADIQRDFHPSKQALPFLPKSSKCLKPGQLAKVIAKSGRVVVGRIRYVGCVASIDKEETYVGLQFPSPFGDCDGSFGGKKFFECQSNFGMFVPFKKVIMAWNS